MASISQVENLGNAILTQLRKVVVGQEAVLQQVLITVLADSHALLEGVPGTAKTLLVKALARCLDTSFTRVQFTPDMMPSDLVGTHVFNVQTSSFHLRQGPLFTNLLLADEINRTPPKTQAALLEAMEERQVTIEGETLPLPPLFAVFATQNPIEYEGTYPLPEAQVDRFLLKIVIDYPSKDQEREILQRYQAGFNPRRLEEIGLQPVGTAEAIENARRAVAQVTVEESVMAYITDIVEATRRTPHTLLGGSPRASIALWLTGKCLAALRGRDYVIPDDVKDMCPSALRHRVLLRPEAEIEGITSDGVIQEILSLVPVPRS